jgi:two-component system, chemotaxis family, chemotaxis protein CheY
MTRILIVDDSSLTRNYHTHILRDAGFTCVTAADGMEGLEKATAEPFHLILSDINMQGMDGYEFIRRVRQNPDYDPVPIVILSTEAKEADKQKGFGVGASLYLVKPTDATRLVESIKMLVGTR